MSQLRVSAWAIRNPTPVSLLFIALMLVGAFAYMNLPVKQFPNIEFPAVAVTIAQSGAAPAEMENQITRPIEDAIALTKALEAERNLGEALTRYQNERQPIVKKLVAAARTSADWYANFADHMKLDLTDFVYSYITRSGRIDDARLRAMAPAFMARYETSRPGSTGGGCA